MTRITNTNDFTYMHFNCVFMCLSGVLLYAHKKVKANFASLVYKQTLVLKKKITLHKRLNYSIEHTKHADEKIKKI